MFKPIFVGVGLVLCAGHSMAQEMPPCEAPLYLGDAPEGSPAGTGGAAGGSAVAICRQLGISVDDFNKTAAANKAAAETGSAA